MAQWATEVEQHRSNTICEKVLISYFMKMANVHLGDTGFGVNQMVVELGMSHTSLHRRLKAATSYSAHHLIRTLHLSKALFLLQNTSLSIKEVAR